MGRRLRLWQPGKIYNVTSRCVDRQFLFRPNHSLGNPLLREDSDPDSLETWNRLVPKPSMINIVGASIGRALEKYPVPVYFAEAQINRWSKMGPRISSSRFERNSAMEIIARARCGGFSSQRAENQGSSAPWASPL